MQVELVYARISHNERLASSVIVSYTDNPAIKNGSAFAKVGMQIAAGVPLQCDEPRGFQTFRIGLFGLDKLTNLDRTVELFEKGLSKLNGILN